FTLYFHLPTGSMFRCPDRFFTLTVLGLAMLAGLGVDCLAQERRPARAVRGGLLLRLLLILGGSAALRTRTPWQPAVDELLGLGSVGALTLLRTYLLAAVAWLGCYLLFRDVGRTALVIALPACIYADLFSTFVNLTPLPETHPTVHVMRDDVVEFLRANQGLQRTYVPSPGFGVIPGPPSKSGMMNGIYVAGDR